MAIRAAIISDPQVDVCTDRCCLYIQTRGVLLISSKIPITDWCVTRLRAWSASTQTVILAGLPKGSDDFNSISFSALGKYSLQSQSLWKVAIFGRRDQKNQRGSCHVGDV